MNRRLWALLAVLLLVLAALAVQVAAGKGKGEGKGKDRDDDRDDSKEGALDDEDEEGDEGEREDGEDRGSRQVKGHGKETDRDEEAAAAAPQPAPASATRASLQDASLSILPTALPGRIQFSFLVSAAGALEGADFAADLPDTGRPWRLSGPGASACSLWESGLGLSCSFDGLAPGDVRLVQASSPIGRAPPWELVAEGSVSSVGDARPGNDAARAGVGLLLA